MTERARRVRLGRRLAAVAGCLGAVFGGGVLVTSFGLGAIEAQARAVVEEDARFLSALDEIRGAMRGALEASRIGGEGAGSRRHAVSERLSDAERRLLGSEREDFAALASAWRTADEGLAPRGTREGAPAGGRAEFAARVLPALDEAGRALDRLERARRASSLDRVGEIRGRVRKARTALGLYVAAMAVVAIAAAAFLRRKVLRPLRRLELATALLARGDLSHRVGEAPDDEIGDLSRRFDRLADRLARAESSRAEFLSMVSHELRSPLSILSGYIGLLAAGRRGPVAPAQAEALAILDRETKRMGDLVEDLLDVARFEAGAFRLAPLPTRTSEALTESLAPLSAEAESRGVAWSVDLRGLPDAVLDPGRMGQAVRNLAKNALKFTPRGGRVAVRGRTDGDAIVIEVADTGPGIRAEDRERIFDRFHQAAPEDFERGGVGLGLAIVRAISRAHGGVAEVASEAGAGSTFTIRIPHRPCAPFAPALLFLLLATASCASVGAWQGAAEAVREGDHAAGATEYEALARGSDGRTSAEAWYQAGLAWVDPANRRRNFGRGLACFRRVDARAASRETVRGARAWISVLEGLVSAREAAAEAEALRRAIEDVRAGEEALRRR